MSCCVTVGKHRNEIFSGMDVVGSTALTPNGQQHITSDISDLRILDDAFGFGVSLEGVRGNPSDEMLQLSKSASGGKAPRKQKECIQCGKVFMKHDHFVRHMKTHTGEKAFECNICKKRFAQKGNLVTHIRIHTGQSPPNVGYNHLPFEHRLSVLVLGSFILFAVG